METTKKTITIAHIIREKSSREDDPTNLTKEIHKTRTEYYPEFERTIEPDENSLGRKRFRIKNQCPYCTKLNIVLIQNTVLVLHGSELKSVPNLLTTAFKAFIFQRKRFTIKVVVSALLSIAIGILLYGYPYYHPNALLLISIALIILVLLMLLTIRRFFKIYRNREFWLFLPKLRKIKTRTLALKNVFIKGDFSNSKHRIVGKNDNTTTFVSNWAGDWTIPNQLIRPEIPNNALKLNLHLREI